MENLFSPIAMHQNYQYTYISLSFSTAVYFHNQVYTQVFVFFQSYTFTFSQGSYFLSNNGISCPLSL